MSLALVCFCATLGQLPRLDERAEAARPADATHALLVGRVLAPGGSSEAGAVIVTSAGGRCVSGADGRFELVVDVPMGAECVDVKALAHRGEVVLGASVRVTPAAPSSITHVGRLLLAPVSTCSARWVPTFGAKTGADREVHELAVFDDGRGPALYVGGDFTSLGGVRANGIARWTGTRWSALESGLSGAAGPYPFVEALATFDDGGGPALYAGGNFASAGGVAANGIARWDGTSWSALGGGVDIWPGAVLALAVFDDGSGPGLYAGGSFRSAGGVLVSGIARWDGAAWSGLGTGMAGGPTTPTVHALAVFDDGTGPALYAGGQFASAGGVAASGIARWDGTAWSALGSGVDAALLALCVFDDGGGAALFAGGAFTSAGGASASRIGRWDGASWSGVGTGTNASVTELAVLDAGAGPALYASGYFTVAGGVPSLPAEPRPTTSRSGTARAGRRSLAA